MFFVSEQTCKFSRGSNNYFPLCVCVSAGCTVGQYCVFAMPDSVVQPTVAPPAHSPEDINASCTLQRLTPDRDIYIVPLDGCGVNKHVRHIPMLSHHVDPHPQERREKNGQTHSTVAG